MQGIGQTVPKYTMGDGVFPQEKSGRGVALTTHIYLASRLEKE